MDTVNLLDEANTLRKAVNRTQDYIENMAWEQALGQMNVTMDVVQGLAADLCQKAFDEGMTKKDIAAAIGFPARTLRGMEKSR